MRLIGKTERLHVFESEPFVISDYYSSQRRFYVGFDPTDAVVHTPLPVVTGLVSFTIDTKWAIFDWLETTRMLDEETAQEVRDEFMGLVKDHLPEMYDPDPEAQEGPDGSTRYLDTVDALDL
jgi:hypothetical protein